MAKPKKNRFTFDAEEDIKLGTACYINKHYIRHDFCDNNDTGGQKIENYYTFKNEL
ncbi:MAG: hypothetical protein IIA06_02400 [Proteobacteria bacterium]|nr:hypothetical protein [Pseudomonadota bacterium]